MKSFTKQEMENGRKTLESRDYPKKIANLDNRSVDYFIVPKAVFKGIPNGLMRFTGKPKDGYVIGVSDEVPQIIQPAFAMSEHDEFMIYGLDDLCRTLHSERNMMRILKGQENIKKSYVENKIKLYDYMIENAEKNPNWLLTQEDVRGFKTGAGYLKKIKSDLSKFGFIEGGE